jgi:hypothetical protein
MYETGVALARTPGRLFVNSDFDNLHLLAREMDLHLVRIFRSSSDAAQKNSGSPQRERAHRPRR